jgi:hypothetical protein
MSTRVRVSLAGLAAVTVIGLGLAVVTRTRPYTKAAHEVQATAHGARRAVATASHSELRPQLERTSWSPTRAANTSGWVGVVQSALMEAGTADTAAPHHSRAPPL